MSKSITLSEHAAPLQAPDYSYISVPSGDHILTLTQLPPEITISLDQAGSRIRVVITESIHTPTTCVIRALHTAPDTHLEIQTRTVVSSQLTVKALLNVAANTSDCESFFSHHSLRTSPTARVFTEPSLEICNNVVACSHAATVRTLSDHDLFYLRSRGIPQTDARNTLIAAFLLPESR